MLRPKFHKNLKAGILLLLVSFCELDAAAPVHGTSETGVSQLPEILLGARVGIGAAQEVVHCLGFATVACRVISKPLELHASSTSACPSAQAVQHQPDRPVEVCPSRQVFVGGGFSLPPETLSCRLRAVEKGLDSVGETPPSLQAQADGFVGMEGMSLVGELS